MTLPSGHVLHAHGSQCVTFLPQDHSGVRKSIIGLYAHWPIALGCLPGCIKYQSYKPPAHSYPLIFVPRGYPGWPRFLLTARLSNPKKGVE